MQINIPITKRGVSTFIAGAVAGAVIASPSPELPTTATTPSDAIPVSAMTVPPSLPSEWGLPNDVIVKVTGTQRRGFKVYRHDGSMSGYPPIRMAKMECLDGRDTEGEIAYQRCMTAVRVEYHWIGETKRAIRYQQFTIGN